MTEPSLRQRHVSRCVRLAEFLGGGDSGGTALCPRLPKTGRAAGKVICRQAAATQAGSLPIFGFAWKGGSPRSRRQKTLPTHPLWHVPCSSRQRGHRRGLGGSVTVRAASNGDTLGIRSIPHIAHATISPETSSFVVAAAYGAVPAIP